MAYRGDGGDPIFLREAFSLIWGGAGVFWHPANRFEEARLIDSQWDPRIVKFR